MPQAAKPVKILALCDSPAHRPAGMPGSHTTTGFACVVENIFKRWTFTPTGNPLSALRLAEYSLDIWALHFDGWGYDQVPWQMFPAGNDWNTPDRLTAFLHRLVEGKYTHVWMLMDPDALCIGSGERSFPNKLREVCKKYGIRSLLYFPVDCEHLEPGWMEIIKAVDVAVTYTEFGRETVRKTMGASQFPLAVVPHGVDGQFAPMADAARQACRDQIQVEDESGKRKAEGGKKLRRFLKPDDFCLLNINKNEWRKDPLRSLEILKGLIEAGVPAKLILRMAPTGPAHCGSIHLERAARQLGLVQYRDWVQMDAVPAIDLPRLYNAADMYLTTTLGEGWGLGITEALACGTPVAMPRHTACAEIGESLRGQADDQDPHRQPVVWLPNEAGCVLGYETRLRRRVELGQAVSALVDYYDQSMSFVRRPLNAAQQNWLSWDRIADEMWKLLMGENVQQKETL